MLLQIFLVFIFCVVCTCDKFVLTVTAFYPNDVGGLYVRGSGPNLSWDYGLQMTKQSPITYEFRLGFNSEEVGQVVELKILVEDSTWMIGKNEVIVLINRSFSAFVYPFFFTSIGKYQYVRNFYSPQLQDTRDLVIFTPASYDENPLKKDYPVLFMHDGQNLFNDSTSFGGVSWRCQDTVNLFVVEGKMDEIIIVGIDNTINRTDELTYSYDPSEQAGGNGDVYLDFIEQTVLPFVESAYRVSTNANKRGILGSSLGGLISCYAGWTRNTYTKVGCMSSSFWWNSEDFNNKIMLKPASSGITFYLDSGDQGPDNDDQTQTISVREHMIQFGWQLNKNLFYYLDHGGQHNEKYWRDRFWIPMSELFPPSNTTIDNSK